MASLTLLYDGPLTAEAYISSDDDRQALRNWFETWLEANKSKQLIVTPAWKEKLKQRFISVCRCVETASSTPGNALYGFRAPDDGIYHGVGGPVFEVEWAGGPQAAFKVPPSGNGWLYACVRTQTRLFHSIKAWEQWPWDVPDKFPREAKLAYKEDIAGTDWAVEIYVKDVPKEELTRLTETLEANKTVEVQHGAK